MTQTEKQKRFQKKTKQPQKNLPPSLIMAAILAKHVFRETLSGRELSDQWPYLQHIDVWDGPRNQELPNHGYQPFGTWHDPASFNALFIHVYPI